MLFLTQYIVLRYFGSKVSRDDDGNPNIHFALIDGVRRLTQAYRGVLFFDGGFGEFSH